MHTLRPLFRALPVVSLALLGACAQQVEDIDRVDDNLLPKSMFDGQWYMLNTVVDTNATATQTFAGLQGPLERVHFQFSRDHLLARRVHEDLIGMDTVATNIESQPSFDGSIVAAYGAQHADVQRQYNASTGEQSNVIGENGSDRRWYEQEYVRPSWSNNLIETNVNGEFAGYIEGGAGTQIMIQAEESEGSLNVEYDDDGNAVYFDFTVRYIMPTPWDSCFLMVGFPGWGVDCGTEEVVVRTSFRKVDTEDVVNAHVPREFDDFDMNLFGFFQKINCVFDERYDCNDYSRVELATIHNIWTNNRDADGRARPYRDRTPKPIVYYLSEEYPIDLIDEAYEIAEQFGRAFQRTVAGVQGKEISEVPRMFYACLNPGTEDGTLPESVRSITRNPDDLRLMEEAFAASAEGYRLGHCKRPGEVKNTGDLRYNFFAWRTDPAAPWYGYGPSAADPLTGEIIHAAANFNGGHLSRDAERVLNIIRIVEGDLTAEEYGYGVNIQEYFDKLRAEADQDLYFGRDLIVDSAEKSARPTVAFDRITGDYTRRLDEAAQRRLVTEELLQDDHLQRILSQPIEAFRMQTGRQADPLARVRGTALEQMLQTPEFVEHMTMGAATTPAQVSDVLRSANGRGVSTTSQAQLDEVARYASPIEVARMLTVEKRFDRLRERWMQGNGCVMMAEDFEPQVIGFAQEMYRYKRYLEATYPDLTPEEIDHELWLEVRGRIYSGVQAHEIGHTVGLRHNFAGTTDAMNYFPQYWSLREQTFDEDCSGDGYETFSTTGFATEDVAPTRCGVSESTDDRATRSAEVMARLREGVLEDGTEVGSIHHFEYSTVMDYHADFNGRQGGLGLFDYAAVAFGYGELLEVFDEAPFTLRVDSEWDRQSGNFTSTDVTRGSARVTTMEDVERWTKRLPGGTQGDEPDDDRLDNPWHFWHYSVLPMMFHADGAGERTRQAQASGSLDQRLAQAWHPDYVTHTGLDAMGNMYNRRLVSASECDGGACTPCTSNAECGGGVCYRSPLNPRQQSGAVPGYCSAGAAGVPKLSTADVVVPYRFCEDYRNGTSAHCNIWDGGADELEIVTRHIRSHNNMYPLRAFRRGRPAFGLWLWPYVSREMSSYRTAVAQYQFWLLSAANRGPEWYAADRAGGAATEAMQDALNWVSGVLTMPSVGTYVPDAEMGDTFVNAHPDPGERFESFNQRFGTVPQGDYVDLTIADGARYQYSQFRRRAEDDRAGYHNFYQYDVLSHFWSKYAAVMALTDGSVDVIGADTDSDNTAFYIPPYLAFPDDVGNWFGAIMAEQVDNMGMCATRNAETGGYEFSAIQMLRPSTYRCNGLYVNPYTAVYGNSDYNMRLYATLFAASSFSANLDYGWLDHSSVYVWGRGETPEVINDRDEQYDWVTYTDERGTTYAARYLRTRPNPNYDPTDPTSTEPEFIDVTNPDDLNADFGPNVGHRMVQRAIDLQVELDATIELERQAEEDPNVFAPVRDSDEISLELDRQVEMIRFLVETNKVFQW